MSLVTPAHVAASVSDRPTPPAVVRRALPQDAAALSAFAARTFVDTYAPHHDPDTLQRHARVVFTDARQAEELADPHGTVLLAFRDGVLCGFVQLRRCAPPPDSATDAPIELHRLYVDRPWHGRGVAPQLLDHARAATGAAALWLKVWERNARAIAFYRKAGFVDVGCAPFFVCDDRLTDRVMATRA